MSRYKFAANMACNNARVLELGCSMGIGASILAESAKNYLGVDLDQAAILTAKENFTDAKFSFLHDDFMGKTYGLFDAIISLDVIEHIHPPYEDLYFQTIMNNLSKNGICVIGTPNITSAPFASSTSQLGHVNLFSQERLAKTLKNRFYQVFPFGMNDEIVHTGFGAMAHYILCVGFHRKSL
jgi:cyclopropane fatty-acyl-phospholipid synthase-like methyltransferase